MSKVRDTPSLLFCFALLFAAVEFFVKLVYNYVII
jgi:hypothetical protein